MDRDPVTRRRVLAATGSALSLGLAGCLDRAPRGTTRPAGASEEPSEPDPLPERPEPDRAPREVTDAAYTEVFDAVVDSVTAIGVEGMGDRAIGTGWMYDGEHVVTNQHIAAEHEDMFLWFTDFGWREASVVGTDVHSDLAVLQVPDAPAEATPLPLVEQSPPVGTEILAIGNPFDLTSTLTTGVISGRNRTIELPGRTFTIPDGVQTDAALNPGNSGGPLVTLDGAVAGVVTAGIGENINFAISAQMTGRVVPSLIENGQHEHSFLGVALRNLSPSMASEMDLPVSWGVYVHEVLDGTPADGVFQGTSRTQSVRGEEVPLGGDVIVRMGDWTVETHERLSAFLALESSPGEPITVEVIRDGEQRVLEVTPDPRANWS